MSVGKGIFMLREIWEPIPDYPYEISNMGRVRSIVRKVHQTVKGTSCVRNIKSRVLAGSWKKTTLTKYHKVVLCKEGKRTYAQVHRLVAKAFLPNPNNLPAVDHIDGNGANNCVDNLCWVTNSENIKRAFDRIPEVKLKIASNGGKAAAPIVQAKALKRWSGVLGNRFIKFHKKGEIHKQAAVTYRCECGVIRTACTVWKELRRHHGKCPVCTNTAKRSSESIL